MYFTRKLRDLSRGYADANMYFISLNNIKNNKKALGINIDKYCRRPLWDYCEFKAWKPLTQMPVNEVQVGK